MTSIACNGCGTWLIHARDMTRRYTTRRIACIWWGIWLSHMRDMTHPYLRHYSHKLYRLQLMLDVTQSYAGYDLQIHACLIAIDVDMGHESSMSETWLTHDALPVIDLGRDSSICGTWLNYMRDVTRRRTRHLPAIDRFHTACQRSCSWLQALLRPSEACRVSESNMYSILWYRIYILTPYRLWLQAPLRPSEECRVSESNMHSIPI